MPHLGVVGPALSWFPIDNLGPRTKYYDYSLRAQLSGRSKNTDISWHCLVIFTFLLVLMHVLFVTTTLHAHPADAAQELPPRVSYSEDALPSDIPQRARRLQILYTGHICQQTASLRQTRN